MEARLASWICENSAIIAGEIIAAPIVIAILFGPGFLIWVIDKIDNSRHSIRS